MRRRDWRLLAATLLALCGAIPAVGHAQATSTFASAAAAFERGHYREALGLFQQARADGVDSPALHYNLGVCQYRVGDYPQAAITFQRLAERFPELRALAEYNRGPRTAGSAA